MGGIIDDVSCAVLCVQVLCEFVVSCLVVLVLCDQVTC